MTVHDTLLMENVAKTQLHNLPSGVNVCVEKKSSTKIMTSTGEKTINGSGPRTSEELMSAIAVSQDRQAFILLYEDFAPRLKSFLIGKKLNEQQAEDLLQEVMLSVWTKAQSYDQNKAKVSTWIFTIARNKYIDRMRKQKYIEVDADDYLPDMVADDQTDENVISIQNVSAVREALSELKPDLYNVISKSFLEEKSHSEIAAELNLPLGTVKSRIRLAFKKLHQKLHPSLGDLK